METKTVLIVEDDPRWQERYTKILAQPEFKTVGSLSLADALEQLERKQFDLAIIDMNLTEGTPQNEGFRVLDEIRKRGDDTATIVSTGYPDTDMAVEAFEEYKVTKFHQKKKWEPDKFGKLVDSALKERPGFTAKKVLSKQFDTGKLSRYWNTYHIAIRELLDEVSQEAEPFVPETLCRAASFKTTYGEEVLQAFGWSRGWGAPIVFRLGRYDTIKHESRRYNRYRPVLANLERPLRKVRSPYYFGEDLAVLLIELVGAPLGQANLLHTLFDSGQQQRFLVGLRDLLRAGCASLYASGKRAEQRIRPAEAYTTHLAELMQRREDSLSSEQEKTNQALEQLNEGERIAEEVQMEINEEGRRNSLMALGFPARDGNLVNAIALLPQFHKEVVVTQTLVSEQLSTNNTYIDKNDDAWPIWGGSLQVGSPATELTSLETEIKFSLLPPTAPITTYASLEKRLDSADSSLDILDNSTRVIFEAIHLIRAFAQEWQPDDRFYRFLLALQASRVAEETQIPDRREGALFSAAWHANRLFE